MMYVPDAGADTAEKAVLPKLQRAEMLPFFAAMPPCLVGIEAFD